MAEIKNLMEGLLDEMNRVRRMIREYQLLPNNAGMLASKLMKFDIKKAENAISSGDTIQMMVSYTKLKEYEN
jgi:hypothetical protein